VTASPLRGPLTSSAQAYRAVATASTDPGGRQMSSTSHGYRVPEEGLVRGGREGPRNDAGMVDGDAVVEAPG
jgi:hypothetical protein